MSGVLPSGPARAARSLDRRQGAALAAAAACVPLALLSDRAFNIDEPLFLWLAEQITRDPLDFFGFDVNWYGTAQPMYAVTRNPPLVGYAIAGAAALVGWSERALHLVFLLPAAAAALASLAVARRTCAQPLLAACLGVWTPVFLVSSNTVMSDTPMLALWCTSIACWLRGLGVGDTDAADGDREAAIVETAWAAPRRVAQRWLWVAAALAALAVATKYFAIALVPLLAATAIAARAPARAWALPLLLPVAVLAGFEILMLELYGAGAIGQAVDEALHVVGIERPGLLRQAAEGLVFAGGCAAPGLFFAPLIWSRRALVGGLVLVAAGVALAPASLAAFGLPLRSGAAASGFGPERIFALQFFAMGLGGASLVALAASELRRGRGPERVLLGAWLLGSLVFAAFLNWTNNGRSNLVLAPVVGVLIARRLSQREVGPRQWGPVLVLCGAFALGVAQSDRLWSNSVREAAREVAVRYGESELWFHGHWGWQYYLERAGGRAVDWKRDEIPLGAVLVVATNNAEVHVPARGSARQIDTISTADPRWLRTQAKAAGASYNASNLGPAPLVVGPVPADQYRVFRALRPIRYERWFDWSSRPAAEPGASDR